jgi:hypothetical protein
MVSALFPWLDAPFLISPGAKLGGRKVWWSCVFASCLDILCRFKNHQQTSAETFSWQSAGTKHA